MLRLTVEREKMGLSKARLGAIAEINPVDIGRMESGRIRPYSSWINKLGKVFGIPGDKLFEEVEANGNK